MIPWNRTVISEALLSELPWELGRHLPAGFAVSADANTVWVLGGPLYEYNGIQVRGHVLKLTPMRDRLLVSHTYYITDDWPFRRAGVYQVCCSKYYDHHGWLDEVLQHVADLGADPHQRDEQWNPRIINHGKREKRRQSMVAKYRYLGLVVADDASMDELKEIHDAQVVWLKHRAKQDRQVPG